MLSVLSCAHWPFAYHLKLFTEVIVCITQYPCLFLHCRLPNFILNNVCDEGLPLTPLTFSKPLGGPSPPLLILWGSGALPLFCFLRSLPPSLLPGNGAAFPGLSSDAHILEALRDSETTDWPDRSGAAASGAASVLSAPGGPW